MVQPHDTSCAIQPTCGMWSCEYLGKKTVVLRITSIMNYSFICALHFFDYLTVCGRSRLGPCAGGSRSQARWMVSSSEFSKLGRSFNFTGSSLGPPQINDNDMINDDNH